MMNLSTHSSVGSVQDLRTGVIGSILQPIFFSRTDDSHCDRIHSSLTAVHCFDDDYVAKQPFAWKEYCVAYWLTLYSIDTHFDALITDSF